MFPILLILFIAVPVIEIGLFIQVGGVLGLWPTIALVLITAFVGASLVRSQGLHTLMTVQQRMQNGEIPAQQIVEGVMLAVAGVLLLTPGFMTDAMGMLILLPAPRAMLAKYLMSKVVVTNMSSDFQSSHYERDFHSHSSQQHGQTFDGEFERKQDDDQDKLNRP
ncbi:membrane protein FxsA [Vibrio fluvialis]